jgi:hypothetical protein
MATIAKIIGIKSRSEYGFAKFIVLPILGFRFGTKMRLSFLLK